MRSWKFQSGCRAVTGGVKRLGGGYWRLEMRLGPGLGYGNAFGVESGPECWGGGGYPPPLPEAIPCPAPFTQPQPTKGNGVWGGPCLPVGLAWEKVRVVAGACLGQWVRGIQTTRSSNQYCTQATNAPLSPSQTVSSPSAGYCLVGKIPHPPGGGGWVGIGMGGWVGPKFQHFGPPGTPPPPRGCGCAFWGVLGLCRALRSA